MRRFITLSTRQTVASVVRTLHMVMPWCFSSSPFSRESGGRYTDVQSMSGVRCWPKPSRPCHGPEALEAGGCLCCGCQRFSHWVYTHRHNALTNWPSPPQSNTTDQQRQLTVTALSSSSSKPGVTTTAKRLESLDHHAERRTVVCESNLNTSACYRAGRI